MSRQTTQERGGKQGRVSGRASLTRAEKQYTLKPALHAASRFSEQRAVRVEALRAQIKAGTYQVDSRMLAEKMLSGLWQDEEKI